MKTNFSGGGAINPQKSMGLETDRIQSNTITSLNGDMLFEDSLTLLKNQDAFTTFRLENTSSGANALSVIEAVAENSVAIHMGAAPTNFTFFPILAGKAFTLSEGNVLFGTIDNSDVEVIGNNFTFSPTGNFKINTFITSGYVMNNANGVLTGGHTGSGTTSHTTLDNLDYDTAGHTGFESIISTGTSAQYYRGDKTWQTFSHLSLSDIGSNSHSVIDTHLAAANPHSNHTKGTSGTINKIAKWTNTDTIDDSNIIDTGSGAIQFDAANGVHQFGVNNGVNNQIIIYGSSGTKSIQIQHDGTIGGILTNTGDFFLMPNSGKTGINTSNPNETLDINGTLRANQHVGFGSDGFLNTFRSSTASVLMHTEEQVINFTYPLYGIANSIGLQSTGNTTQQIMGSVSEVSINNNYNYTGVIMGNQNIVLHGGTGIAGGIDSPLIGGFNAVENKSNGTIAMAIGLLGQSVNEGIGTIDTAIGIIGFVENLSTGGTITNATTILAGTPENLGTITDLTGLYVEDHSGIGTNTSYNILSEGTSSKNIFEGDIEITTNTKGVILNSATKRWRLRVDDLGIISTDEIT